MTPDDQGTLRSDDLGTFPDDVNRAATDGRGLSPLSGRWARFSFGRTRQPRGCASRNRTATRASTVRGDSSRAFAYTFPCGTMGLALLELPKCKVAAIPIYEMRLRSAASDH